MYATREASDLMLAVGSDVTIGDQIRTDYGWAPPITHFVTPPDDSFAAQFFGQGVRMPYSGQQPLRHPIAPDDVIAIRDRAEH